MGFWERICKDWQDFGRGFARIRDTLGEDLQGFVRIYKTLGEDSQGFMRHWERIHEDFCKDS